MKRKIISKVLSMVMLFICIFTCVFTGCGEKTGKTSKKIPADSKLTFTKQSLTTLSGTEAQLSSMKLVTENAKYAFYADTVTGKIGTLVKESGKVWLSNPIEAATDDKATPYAKSQLESQLVLTYHDKNANDFTMNSFDDCVKAGQLAYTLTENGICFEYTFGELEEALVIPRYISETRMNAFTDKMSDRDKSKVLRQYSYINLEDTKESERKELEKKYPAAAKHNLYVLRDNSEFLQKELMEIFEPAGYSRADLAADSKENGFISNRTKPYFVVRLDYKLTENGLTASIPAELIQYDEELFPLTDISLNPYFGTAYKDHSGYLFVPDGSGATINFNNGRTGVGSYIQPVYGIDTAYSQAGALEADKRFSIKMPVYGIKDGNSAFLAVIEDGDALATITADISGKQHSFNFVYPSFNFLPFGRIAIGKIMDDGNKLYMYAEDSYKGNLTVSYRFLDGEKANYIGMANAYREKLLNENKLNVSEKNELTFFAEFLGGVSIKKKMLGVPYDSPESLTTYKQAGNILDKLSAKGIGNISLLMSGWYNNGDGSNVSKVKPFGELEDEISLNEFIKSLNSKNITSYFDAEIQYVKKDGAFDGFSSKDMPIFFDKKTVALKNGETRISLVRPNRLEYFTHKFLENTKALNLPGVYTGSLNYELFSDFTSNSESNRQTSLFKTEAALKKLKKKTPVLADNANAYALCYAQSVINAPLFSNKFAIIDEQVPFYAAVLHGCIPYTGEAINLAQDYREVLLKSVESGAGLYFKWINADNALLKGTQYDSLYSVNYEQWIDEAVKMYARANAVLKDVANDRITAHEKLSDNLYITKYESGTGVYVNYGSSPETVNGIEIPPYDFISIKGVREQ